MSYEEIYTDAYNDELEKIAEEKKNGVLGKVIGGAAILGTGAGAILGGRSFLRSAIGKSTKKYLGRNSRRLMSEMESDRGDVGGALKDAIAEGRLGIGRRTRSGVSKARDIYNSNTGKVSGAYNSAKNKIKNAPDNLRASLKSQKDAASLKRIKIDVGT